MGLPDSRSLRKGCIVIPPLQHQNRLLAFEQLDVSIARSSIELGIGRNDLPDSGQRYRTLIATETLRFLALILWYWSIRWSNGLVATHLA